MKPKAPRRISEQEQRTRMKDFLINHDDYDSATMDERYGRKKYMVRLVLFS